jgi:hypothetical protein
MVFCDQIVNLVNYSNLWAVSPDFLKFLKRRTFMGKRKLSIALIVFAAVIAMGGCGSSDGGGGYSPVTLDKPTYVVGDIPSDNPMFADFEVVSIAGDNKVDRIPNRVDKIDDAKVLIIHDDVVVSKLSALQAEVRAFFERGGMVILVEPSQPVLQQISIWTGAHLSAAGDNGAERFADIYAFYNDPTVGDVPSTGYHTYVLGDKPDRYKDFTLTELVSTVFDKFWNLDNVTIQPEFPFEHRAITKWEAVEMVDHFIEWVNNNGPKGSRERLANVKVNLDSQLEAVGDVADLVKAQTVTLNKETPTFVGPKHIAKYSNTYFIYAIYDKDHDYDYYIVEQEAHVQSGSVYDGTWSDHIFLLTINGVGDYLFDYYTDHYLMSGSTYLNESKVDILKSSPQTTTVNTDLTTGFTLSFSGNLGFNSSGVGSGGVTGGMSYSSSRKTTIPDVRVVYQEGLLAPFATGANNNARWTYQPALVEIRGTSISSPPAISVNTAIFLNTWIWRVQNPANDAYFTMRCVAMPRFAYTELHLSLGLFPIDKDNYVNIHISDADDYKNAPQTDIVFDRPPRS